MKCRLCGKDTHKTWPRLCSMCDHAVACTVVGLGMLTLLVVGIVGAVMGW